MAHVDNTALANKKNRIGKSKLQSELQRLDKERKTELRMLNNEKQRFKCKYCSILPERRGTDPSNVVMYETHNPGFCYRRNGECRMAQSPITNTSLGIEDIHALIFSQEEVNVDKVLCLHLLGAHRTETLTPPPRSQRTVSYTSKEHSPLERLIERSKRRHPEDKLMKLLPVYVLDVTHRNNEPLIRDGRLANRLIINEKVAQLVRSVMKALSNSNQDKLMDMVEKSKNKEYLKFLLCTHDMQEFITSLNGLNIISCCESFYLTVPFKLVPVDLEVRTPNGYLERLVTQIRKNIFKPPICSNWHQSFSKQGSFSSSLTQLTLNKEKELCLQSLENTTFASKITKRFTLTNSSGSSKSSMETTKSLFGQKQSEPGVYKNERKIRSVPPKRLSHDERPASLIQGYLGSFDESKIKENNLDNFSNLDFEKIANVLCKKVKNANKRDIAESQLKQEEEQEVEGSAQQVKFEKYSLKQTTCPACLQKWRLPLPSPKTSKIRKSKREIDSTSADDMITNSTHIISKMIDDELKNWHHFNATTSLQSSPSSSPRYSPRSSSVRSNVIEIIDLDKLDLAKIRQEIRENETRKKLNKFLGESNK